MTDIERRAILGDEDAQRECTENGIILPCPCCRGNGKVSFKDYKFCGQNYRGDKKLIYRVQVICNKCRSRGKPVFTIPLINPNPYITKWGNCYYAGSDVCKEETEKFLPYVMAAVAGWNTRIAPPIGRCGECSNLDQHGNCMHFEWDDVGPLMNKSDFCSGFKPKGESRR